MPNEEIWSEVKEGEVVKPEIGDVIEGQLLDIRPGENGKVYDIQTEAGRVTLFGTTILDHKMARVANAMKLGFDRPLLCLELLDHFDQLGLLPLLHAADPSLSQGAQDQSLLH